MSISISSIKNIGSNFKSYYEKVDRKKLLVYTLIILTILRFVVYPLKEHVKEDKETLQSKLKNYMEDIKLYTSKKPININMEKETSVSIENLHTQDEKAKEIQINLVKIVKSYAKKNNLNLQNIEIPKPTKAKYLEQIDVKVSINTQDPYKVFSLMEYLEALPKYTVIKETQISAFGPNISFTLTISTYKLERKI